MVTVLSRKTAASSREETGGELSEDGPERSGIVSPLARSGWSLLDDSKGVSGCLLPKSFDRLPIVTGSSIVDESLDRI